MYVIASHRSYTLLPSEVSKQPKLIFSEKSSFKKFVCFLAFCPSLLNPIRIIRFDIYDLYFSQSVPATDRVPSKRNTEIIVFFISWSATPHAQRTHILEFNVIKTYFSCCRLSQSIMHYTHTLISNGWSVKSNSSIPLMNRLQLIILNCLSESSFTHTTHIVHKFCRSINTFPSFHSRTMQYQSHVVFQQSSFHIRGRS